jgi:four helix bundle protein
MSGHVWDLEERATVFALAVRAFIRRLPASTANSEDSKQLIRSSGSVPANYIEANEALGNKDRVMKPRISRKESKESQLWLRLLFLGPDADLEKERERLRQEAHELKLIFTSIIKKLE